MPTKLVYRYRLKDNDRGVGEISGTVSASSERAAIAKVYEKHLMLGKTLSVELETVSSDK